MRFQNFLLRAAWAGVVCVAFATGCANEKTVPKTASSGDALSGEARRFRAGDGDRDGTGLSSQSRDIEKDLGYR